MMRSTTPNKMPESSQVREEIRELLLSSTSHKQRLNIIARLKEKPNITASLLPLVFSNLQSKDFDLQDLILELAEHLENQGYTLSSVCAEIASHLSSPRKSVREQATRMLVNLGPDGKQAEDFALGCLRNREREIAMNGLKILKSIGNALSRGITQRVNGVTDLYPNDREICDLAAEIVQMIGKLGDTIPLINENLPQQPCLLVDPDKVFRDQFAQTLRKSGLSTLGCSTAEDAIPLIERGGHFLVVISEIKLGNMSGLQFAQWVRQKYPSGNLPFIFMSSVSNCQIINAAKNSGACEYILKGTPLQSALKMIHQAAVQ